MKKVLIISYHFPPMGGGGVMRALKFSKYLPQFGWIPIILTANSSPLFRDESLLNDLDPRIKIIRTSLSQFTKLKYSFIRKLISSRKPTNIKKNEGVDLSNIIVKILTYLNNKIEKAFFIPDIYILWRRKAVSEAQKIIKEEKIDLLFTTSPPHSIQLIGKIISEKTGIPWISDFRDDWINNPLFTNKFIIQKYLGAKQEKSVINNTNKIITATESIKQDMLKRHAGRLRDNNVTVITNGYDPDDFNNEGSILPLNKNRLTFSYYGNIGGTRSSLPLLEGIRIAKEKNKHLINDIVINFIGIFGDSKKHWYKSIGDSVNFISPLNHTECIKNMKRSDILLLILNYNEGGGGVLTGKIFEYIASKKPIFAIIPKGTTQEFIKNENLGFVADYHNPNEIAEAITDIYQQWKNNKLVTSASKKILSKYDRKELTRKLSQEFNTTLKLCL